MRKVPGQVIVYITPNESICTASAGPWHNIAASQVQFQSPPGKKYPVLVHHITCFHLSWTGIRRSWFRRANLALTTGVARSSPEGVCHWRLSVARTSHHPRALRYKTGGVAHPP